LSIVSTTQDVEGRTLTIVADFAAPPERVWKVWSDPRQLERWWGPPTWPATFEEHDVRVGGRSRYYMTGPDGEKAGGWWEFVRIDEPHSLEFEDGFSNEAGEPDEKMPTIRARVEFERTDTGTRMTMTSSFTTLEQMQQLVDMGMVEGINLAMGQIDGLLAEA
jgi:uncharacterized protein YndB with AHSA1/START domain